MSKDYVLNEFQMAIEDLATGESNVRDRLLKVYCSRLHKIREDDFPPHLINDWKEIEKSLANKEPFVLHDGTILRGSVEMTMRNIKNKTGSKIVKNILKLYHNLEEHKDI